MSLDKEISAQVKREYPNSQEVDEIIEYITEGKPVGGFLRAVLSNDLFGAYSRSDASNGLVMRDIVRWLQRHAPMACHGSREIVDRWCLYQGTKGELREIEDTLT